MVSREQTDNTYLKIDHSLGARFTTISYNFQREMLIFDGNCSFPTINADVRLGKSQLIKTTTPISAVYTPEICVVVLIS